MKISTRALWRVVRIAIGLILIIALIPILRDPDFWSTLKTVNVPLLVVSLVLSVASVISKAWRWGIVMRWRGIKLSLGYLFFSYYISMFFNNFLPSGMGGDVVRAYEAARDTGRGAESIISVVIERGSGMLAVFAAGSIGALFIPGLPLPVSLLAHGLFLGSMVAIWALWLDLTGRVLDAFGRRLPARLGGLWGKITRVYLEFKAYRHEWRLLINVMWQSMITLALTLASVYALLLAFNTPVAFAAFTAVFSIVTAIDVIPLSPNSLGIREGTYTFFLGLIGVAQPIALGVALMVRLIVLIQAVFGGIAFVWRSVRGKRPVATSALAPSPVDSIRANIES